MIKLQVDANVYATEDHEKLQKTIKNLFEFPSIEISSPDEHGICHLTAIGEGPDTLHFLFNQVRNQKTVEAVRRHVLYRMDLNNNFTAFYLHKQALVNKRIVLCHELDESPLDPITVKISATDIERTIEYLFPPTKAGKVLEVEYSLNNHN